MSLLNSLVDFKSTDEIKDERELLTLLLFNICTSSRNPGEV